MGREKRDELFITVPSLFRCPISMDVMKSPVSLSTGVTYDRSSIQMWLSQGHKTCPATMQVLPSTDVTPNLTLRRLIDVWLHHNPADVTPSSSTSAQEALDIIRNHLNDSDRVKSLNKIIDFLKHSEENRKVIAGSNDAVLKIVEVLDLYDEIEVWEAVVTILDLILLENGVREQLNQTILRSNRDLLSRFILNLQKGSLNSRIKSARILELIAINSESQRKISEKHGLVSELYRLISSETNRFAVDAGLSAIIAISSNNRQVKKELVRFGIIRSVVKILSGSETVNVIEKAMKLLEIIATCTEGRAAIGEDEDCVVEIVKRLIKCSRATTEHGITVVWSVCCMARDERAKERVNLVNGLTKILLVMQSDCSAGVRHMCGELVKVLRVKNNNNSSKSCLASYDTKTTHIMPY